MQDIDPFCPLCPVQELHFSPALSLGLFLSYTAGRSMPGLAPCRSWFAVLNSEQAHHLVWWGACCSVLVAVSRAALLAWFGCCGTVPFSPRTLTCFPGWCLHPMAPLPFQSSPLSQLSDIKCKGLVHVRLWKSSDVCHRLLLQIRAMYLQNRLMKVLISSKKSKVFRILPRLCTVPHFPVAMWQADICSRI